LKRKEKMERNEGGRVGKGEEREREKEREKERESA
jgi:hypothetical protein